MMVRGGDGARSADLSAIEVRVVVTARLLGDGQAAAPTGAPRLMLAASLAWADFTWARRFISTDRLQRAVRRAHEMASARAPRVCGDLLGTLVHEPTGR